MTSCQTPGAATRNPDPGRLPEARARVREKVAKAGRSIYKEVKKGALKTKSKDGKKLFFRFNNGFCQKKNCGFHQSCQKCSEEGHGKKDCGRAGRAVA